MDDVNGISWHPLGCPKGFHKIRVNLAISSVVRYVCKGHAVAQGIIIKMNCH